MTANTSQVTTADVQLLRLNSHKAQVTNSKSSSFPALGAGTGLVTESTVSLHLLLGWVVLYLVGQKQT
jgi:hypothetical protein